MTINLIDKLQTWRDANHDKTITLTRSEVIVLLELLRDRPRDDGTHVHRLDEREGDQ
jgi:hypothetical protein